MQSFSSIWPWLLAGFIPAALIFGGMAMTYRARARDASVERRRAEARANRTRDILAAAPDGIFLWDHATGGITCSRKLADMLQLEAGSLARYDDIRACFGEDDLQKLEQGVSLLRAKGTPFEASLSNNGEALTAVGSRAYAPDGAAVADIVWLRKPDGGPVAQAAGRNRSGLEDKHLTALLDALPVPLWLRDADLNIAFLNRAAERVDGIGDAIAQEARAKGGPVRGDMDLTENGQPRPVRAIETPLSPEANRGTIGFAVDRETRAAPPAPAPATPKPHAPVDLLRPLTAGVAVFDKETLLVAANRAFADLWRIDADWLESRPAMNDMLARLRELRRLPEVADFAAFRRQELSRFGGMERLYDDELYLPDGRTIRRRIGPLDDGGIVMVCEDVSGRLDLQRSLKSADRVQRTTLDNLREGVCVFGGDGRLRLINPQMLTLWDLTQDDLAAERRLADVIDTLGMRMAANAEPWPERRERIAQEILARTPSTGRVELVSDKVLAFANIPLPDGAALVSYSDITDSFKVEEALRERARMLAETDRMKTEFIANVATEIRNPVTTITGFADVLRQEMFGTLTDRQHEYTGGILNTANRMMGVVDNIMDLANIEAGRLSLKRGTVDVHTLLVDAINEVTPRAKEKNLKISFDCDHDIGFISADLARLRQVLNNILSNAVHFTPKLGQVGATAERNGDWLDIAVSDSGPGIPKDDRERVFEPFNRIKDSKHQTDGPGLGLTIVRRFIELHGGAVLIRGNKARGTTVVCRLPVDGENAEGLAPFADDRAILDNEAAE